MNTHLLLILVPSLLVLSCMSAANADEPGNEAPAPFGPVPSERQLRWHELEYYGFFHFTINTFTNKEWGYGDESPALFDPTSMNAEQWADVAQKAGMKGMILTAKHHDGFCLWPCRHTKHSVKGSPWKEGKGDVLRDVRDACAKRGLKFGIYLSPWDCNHADYGSKGYIEYYRAQLKELLTGYGDLFEVWFDGANGGRGYYGGAREHREIDRKTYYGWQETWALVRKLQPMAVMFSDAGPDIRWVGNERGVAAETCWATVRPEGTYPGISDTKRLTSGDRDGTVWRPAEVDVSIRPGWFYHPEQDNSVKTLNELLEIYYQSVGMGANLLLNVPPDRRGRIHENDEARLMELKQVLDRTFDEDLALNKPVSASNTRANSKRFSPRNVNDGDRDTYWATDDTEHTAQLVIDLEKTTPFNRIRIQERIELGQRIETFSVDALVDGEWRKIADGTCIGARRILRSRLVRADKVRLKITKCPVCPTISTFELYLAPDEGGR